MEIGKQIKTLRIRRGITQEAMGQHFGISPQAVSKWERGEASPDIAMLPELSAYFGVTIDALFSLSDDTRMERIQNMLWDVRYLDPEDVKASREFLLEKARREPENGRPHELLAGMEGHLAETHKELSAQYAMEAIRRDPDLNDVYSLLNTAMNGKCWDWCSCNHHRLIDFYRDCIDRNPGSWHPYLWLMDQLIDDYRFDEAEEVLARYKAVHDDYRTALFRGTILWHRGRQEEAFALWEALQQQYPDKWGIPETIADYYARSGEYDKSISWHRKALAVAQPPRYVDPLESIAQICEIQGNYQGAIDALREELKLDAEDWHTTEGEMTDAVHREIQRLEKKL